MSSSHVFFIPALLLVGSLLGYVMGRRMLLHEQQQQRERQMRDLELESKQKLWQWLISGALLLLITETWLAGRLTVKKTKDEGDDG